MRKIFVTGTDTNIGKTYSCIKLLKKFSLHNYKTKALKPVATGYNNASINETVAQGKFFEVVSGAPARKAAVYTEVHEDLRTDKTPKCSKKDLVQRSLNDTLLLQKYTTEVQSYDQITAFSFPAPVSPNIACPDLTAEKIYQEITPSFNEDADICLIEGVGGWCTPINNDQTMEDLVKLIEDIEIILVVGIKLGCLNHALLTYQAIKNTGLNFLGWIANLIDPEMLAIEENISTLQNFIGKPPLEILQYDRQSS